MNCVSKYGLKITSKYWLSKATLLGLRYIPSVIWAACSKKEERFSPRKQQSIGTL